MLQVCLSGQAMKKGPPSTEGVLWIGSSVPDKGHPGYLRVVLANRILGRATRINTFHRYPGDKIFTPTNQDIQKLWPLFMHVEGGRWGKSPASTFNVRAN